MIWGIYILFAALAGGRALLGQLAGWLTSLAKPPGVPPPGVLPEPTATH